MLQCYCELCSLELWQRLTTHTLAWLDSADEREEKERAAPHGGGEGSSGNFTIIVYY